MRLPNQTMLRGSGMTELRFYWPHDDRAEVYLNGMNFTSITYDDLGRHGMAVMTEALVFIAKAQGWRVINEEAAFDD